MHDDATIPDDGDPGIPIIHYATIAERFGCDAGDAFRRRSWRRRNSRRGDTTRAKARACQVKP